MSKSDILKLGQTKTNIKKLRTKYNILQTKLAMDLNLSQEAISSYEIGRVSPSSDMLIKLADYFHTNIDYILCRTKYDLPVDSLKPNNLNDKQFEILIKINKLSNSEQDKVEGYIDGLTDK
jgi:transcriptional regulator with XRE-family HTH domain